MSVKSTNLVAKFVGLAAALALGVSVTACSTAEPVLVPSATGVDAAVTVRVVDNQYIPQTVEINAGEAVEWVFEGSMEHDVIAANGTFASPLLSDDSYIYVFEAAGEYAYDCSIHPEMTGMVIVK